MSKKNLTETIRNIMDNLDRAFCSEADFQHVLAWKLHETFPEAEIFLEYPVQVQDGAKTKIYYDIAIKIENEIHFIELKYKTNTTTIMLDKTLELNNQGAYPLSCCYFWFDVKRMEDAKNTVTNYCIFLSNNPIYWNGSNKDDIIHKDFELYNGRTISYENNQNWKNQKESPWWPTDGKDFSLNGKYICNWKNTKIKSCGKKYNEWKYLLLEVKPK
ncbi:MAG: hypothetical protein IJW31_06590 [Lentisphaeria bacterium]|nr:hypothetical protein [Lentisphaeria bacterium]